MNLISLIFILGLSTLFLGVYNAVYYLIMRVICKSKKKKSITQLCVEYAAIFILIIFFIYFRLIFRLE